MSGRDIPAALEAFRTAIEDDEFATAEDALGTLNDLFDAAETEEAARVKQAREAVSDGAVTGSQREAVQQYVGRKVAAGMGRAGLLSSGRLYLMAPSEGDASNVLDDFDQLVENEKQKLSAEESAEQALSDATLQATPSIVSVAKPDSSIVVGETMAADVVVRNVGDVTASGLELSAETALDVDPTADSVGSLAGGEEQTRTFEFTGPEGDYDVEVVLERDDEEVDSKHLELSVASKTTMAEYAADSLEDIRELITENDSLGYGWTTALLASLDQAAGNVEDALRFMAGDTTGPGHDGPADRDTPGRGSPDDQPGRGPPEGDFGRGPDPGKRANNALTTAINQMGAFLNKVTDFREEDADHSSVSDGFWFTLLKQGELVIDQLDAARRAELVDGQSDNGSAGGDEDEEGGHGPPDDRGGGNGRGSKGGGKGTGKGNGDGNSGGGNGGSGGGNSRSKGSGGDDGNP